MPSDIKTHRFYNLLLQLWKLRDDAIVTTSIQSLVLTLQLVHELFDEYDIDVALESKDRADDCVFAAIVVLCHQIIDICSDRRLLHENHVAIRKSFEEKTGPKSLDDYRVNVLARWYQSAQVMDLQYMVYKENEFVNMMPSCLTEVDQMGLPVLPAVSLTMTKPLAPMLEEASELRGSYSIMEYDSENGDVYDPMDHDMAEDIQDSYDMADGSEPGDLSFEHSDAAHYHIGGKACPTGSKRYPGSSDYSETRSKLHPTKEHWVSGKAYILKEKYVAKPDFTSEKYTANPDFASEKYAANPDFASEKYAANPDFAQNPEFLGENDSEFMDKSEDSDADFHSEPSFSEEEIESESDYEIKSAPRVKRQSHSARPPCKRVKVPTIRSNYPRETIQGLKEWLFEHYKDPYPSEIQKKSMMKEYNLSLVLS